MKADTPRLTHRDVDLNNEHQYDLFFYSEQRTPTKRDVSRTPLWKLSTSAAPATTKIHMASVKVLGLLCLTYFCSRHFYQNYITNISISVFIL